MKVVAYSINPFEKEFLIRANQKKHDITLISNALSVETAAYAKGKDAVLVFTNDDVSENVIDKLAGMGVKFIATRSKGTDHINKKAAEKRGIKLANVPTYSPQAIAEHTVALALALGRHLIKANERTHDFDFRLNDLIGFNFNGKTVGIIGLGEVGLATANIFRGLGCKVIGHDILLPKNVIDIEIVELGELCRQADIISLHLPVTEQTHHIVNKDTIRLMKPNVMLLNTSRGGLIDTKEVLNALENGKIGYLGLDVYEFEQGLFFEDHEHDKHKDALLKKLIAYPNVLVTPHQAFLTREALQQIANQTIKNLDLWQEEKCVGDACACDKDCGTKAVIKPTIQDNFNHLP
ncbi:MAG: 2-hydroxyacid dehydrogenase [Bacteroidetes bacterium]|nr:2-hydroxyacid dehydrogenase [Bacteroidota bacterium]